MNITHYLQPYYSKRDSAGNVYWAFKMRTADEPELEVRGYISGGESNIDSIRYDWDGQGNGWEGGRTIVRLAAREVSIREFDKIQKTWPYAGCARLKLQSFIREQFKALNGDKP